VGLAIFGLSFLSRLTIVVLWTLLSVMAAAFVLYARYMSAYFPMPCQIE
jgi:hypothetical protein